MARQAPRFTPDAIEALEGRVVLSHLSPAQVLASQVTAASVANLGAFRREVKAGQAPTLNVAFGTRSLPVPASTVEIPYVQYSAKKGFGFLGIPDPSKYAPTLAATPGAISGQAAQALIQLPRGTYDVTVDLNAATNQGNGLTLQVRDGNTANTGGGLTVSTATAPRQETFRVTIIRNGLTVALANGFSIRGLQITPVASTGPGGPGASTPAASSIQATGVGGSISLNGASTSPAVAPNEAGGDFAIYFPSTDPTKIRNITAKGAGAAGVSGTITSGVVSGLVQNWGDVFVNTPQGRVHVRLTSPPRADVTLAQLAATPLTLNYQVVDGNATYTNAPGTGTVDVSLTPDGGSTDGIIVNGAVNPSVVYGALNLNFHPAT